MDSLAGCAPEEITARVLEGMRGPIYRFIQARLRLEPGAADDVFQDFCVRLQTSAEAVANAKTPRSFVFGIAQRAAGEWIRGRQRRPLAMGSTQDSQPASSRRDSIGPTQSAKVRELFDELPEMEQQLLVLRTEGESWQSIVQILRADGAQDVPEADALKVRYSRMLERLRTEARARNIEPPSR